MEKTIRTISIMKNAVFTTPYPARHLPIWCLAPINMIQIVWWPSSKGTYSFLHQYTISQRNDNHFLGEMKRQKKIVATLFFQQTISNTSGYHGLFDRLAE